MISYRQFDKNYPEQSYLLVLIPVHFFVVSL